MRARRMVLWGAWVAAIGLLAATTAQAKGPKTRDKELKKIDLVQLFKKAIQALIKGK